MVTGLATLYETGLEIGNLGWGSSVEFSESTGSVLGPWNYAHVSEPWNTLQNTLKLYLLRIPVSHLLDSLIGPSELLLVVSHLLAFQVQFGEKLVTKTWMSEIFLQGHILSVGGDALSTPSVGFGGIQFNWKTQWVIRFGCIRSAFVASCHYFHMFLEERLHSHFTRTYHLASIIH